MASGMCSVTSSSADPRAQFPPPRLRSIRGRLTLLYILSAVGILALAVVFLQWALASSLQDEDDRFLSQKVQTLRLILRECPVDSAALRQEVEQEGGVLQFTPYYIRVVDGAGRPLTETAGMAAHVPAPFPRPTEFDGRGLTGKEWRAPDGRAYLLASCWIGFGSGRHLLHVALDVSHDDALIASYRRKMAVIFVLGVLVSATAGAWVARRGLHPLAQITEAASRITPSRLNGRIGPSGWPDELSELVAAFDAMLDRLEDSFTRLSRFSADIAHELRTPVGNLAGEAEVSLSRVRTPDEYRQVIESSLEEYARLSQIIEGLLFLARAESTDFQVSRIQLVGAAEVDAIRDYFEAVADEQGVTVTCEGDAAILAAPTLLRRAVANLVSNALQSTSRGGRVTVAVRPLEDGSTEVSIADTGIGIAATDLPRVFDRFYQCDPSRSRDGRGSGLGLSIVQSIMAAHGGAVRISSTPGQGTMVLLTFPGQVTLRPDMTKP